MLLPSENLHSAFAAGLAAGPPIWATVGRAHQITPRNVDHKTKEIFLHIGPPRIMPACLDAPRARFDSWPALVPMFEVNPPRVQTSRVEHSYGCNSGGLRSLPV